MSTINSHFNPAIRLNLTATHMGEAQWSPSPRQESSVELNHGLLKALIVQLEKPGEVAKLERIRAIFNEYKVGTSADDFSDSKLHAAAAELIVVNRNVQNESHRNVQTQDDVYTLLSSLTSQVNRTQGVLDSIQREMTIQGSRANYSLGQLKATIMKEAQIQQTPPKKESVTTHTSYAQLWAAMATAIDNIKSGYVDFYADLMQKYTKMYEAYNKYVQGAASKAVKAGKDGNNVKFSQSEMQKGYDDFSNARKEIDLGDVNNWNDMSEEEKKSMTTTLEPAFKVSKSGAISFNIDSYSSAPGSPAGIANDDNVSVVSYQAWLASFNAGASALQSNMQAFAQRYSQANSTFDNLNKVLSGSISSLADSAKELLRNLS